MYGAEIYGEEIEEKEQERRFWKPRREKGKD